MLSARPAPAASRDTTLITTRHADVSRERATQRPLREQDQAIVGGWPLYRTDRGQAAFNAAMATLKATEGTAPSASAFRGCPQLVCNLVLPRLRKSGWIPPGRLWVSPSEYVLFAQSPRRPRRGKSYRLRTRKRMKLFVFHEFHNSTRNTDTYDTISSHKRSVFVPFYMSKQRIDAYGLRFVVVMQVAPYNVKSIHASNMGNAGAGMEVAKNKSDTLEPLQKQASILVATIVKTAAPYLRVVNHQGREGLTMLQAYKRRLTLLRKRSGAPTVTLPFVPARMKRIAAATGNFGDLLLRPGASPKKPRGKKPARQRIAAAKAKIPAPALKAPLQLPFSPLAEYLRKNLATLMSGPGFSAIIPRKVAAIGEDAPGDGIVYLLDAARNVLGHIEAQRKRGTEVKGRYVYIPLGRAAADENSFALDLTVPAHRDVASLASNGTRNWTLAEPPRLATRPRLGVRQ